MERSISTEDDRFPDFEPPQVGPAYVKDPATCVYDRPPTIQSAFTTCPTAMCGARKISYLRSTCRRVQDWAAANDQANAVNNSAYQAYMAKRDEWTVAKQTKLNGKAANGVHSIESASLLGTAALQVEQLPEENIVEPMPVEQPAINTTPVIEEIALYN